jgi:hypothetical protein
VFDPTTKEKARQSHRLLVLAGYGSHLTIDFIDYCNRNRILLAIFSPNSTHRIQPLDVIMFKPLSSGYSLKVSSFIEKCQSFTSMGKQDFYPLFVAAWESSFMETTILRAFEATGLSPFNSEVILERFNMQDNIEASGDSSSSAFSASNWRKTESLLRQVDKDRGDPRPQNLS